MATQATSKWQSGVSRWASLRNWITQPFVIEEPVAAALSRAFILLLVAADFALMALHIILWYTPMLSSDYFSLGRERGYSEFFQYTKAFWLLLLFAWIAFRSRQLTYLFWSFIFGYMLIDDAAGIHEKAGVLIQNRLAISAQFGLRGADFGELIFYALMMGSLLILLGIVFYFGTAAFRRTSIYLVFLLGIFAFFASIVDVLHMLVRETYIFKLVDVLEDGGEMVVMSVIVWYVVLMVARGVQKDAHLTT